MLKRPGFDTPDNDDLPIYRQPPDTGLRRLAGRARYLLISLAIILAVPAACLGGFLALSSHILQRSPYCYRVCTSQDTTPPTLLSISMVSPTEGWAVGRAHQYQGLDVIYHYQNGHWKPISNAPYVQTLHSVFMLSATEGWAVGDYGVILHCLNGQWNRVTYTSQLLLTSPDTPQESPTPTFPPGVDTPTPPPTPEVSPTVTPVPGLDTPTPPEATPTQAPNLAQYTLNSISMVSPTEGWAVGSQEIILHYQNGAWTVASALAFRPLSSIFMLSADEGWAVGRQGTILHYSGGVWQSVPSVIEQDLNSVVMVSASEGWAVGAQGTILHYHNGSWEVQQSDTALTLTVVAMVSASEGWAVGGSQYDSQAGVILHYSQGQWTQIASPTHAAWYSLALVSSTEGWAGGTNGTLLHYQDGKWG